MLPAAKRTLRRRCSRAIQQGAASGQKPAEDLYKEAVCVAWGARSPTALELSRQWVAAYPTPDSWHDALAIYRNIGNPDRRWHAGHHAAALARPIRCAGAVTIMSMRRETIDSMNYGEAQAVLAEGISAGHIKAADPVVPGASECA